MAFWQMLKVGYDHFEVTRQPPKVDVCNKRYVFNADAGGGQLRRLGGVPGLQRAGVDRDRGRRQAGRATRCAEIRLRRR